MKTKMITKTYTLQIYPNFQKMEDVRYSSSRYKLFLQHFLTQLYHKPETRFLSTKGMGRLANKAQKQAMDIVRGIRARDMKSNCPEAKFDICPGTVNKAKGTNFDYWITVNSQWKNIVRVPAKSHKALNKKLREGWGLSKHCEITKSKNGGWFVRVFVSKKFVIPEPKAKSLGVDVGIVHGGARSDKYLGASLKPIMVNEKIKQAERRRQKHLKKPFKTILKQQLDIEVKRALARCQTDSLNLVVEHPKALANLRAGKLGRWAKSYFANRVTEKAIEHGVYIVWVNPAYTSITCSCCGHIDKQSRVSQSRFVCSACGSSLNADVNAAFNIARKGQESLSHNAKAINPLGGPK